MCDRCEELEEEVARLKRLIGEIDSDVLLSIVRAAFKVKPKAARLLFALYQAKGPVTYLKLQDVIYGGDPSGGPDSNIIQTMVYQIRRKAGAFIGTDWGFGYYLTDLGRAKIDTEFKKHGLSLAA